MRGLCLRWIDRGGAEIHRDRVHPTGFQCLAVRVRSTRANLVWVGLLAAAACLLLGADQVEPQRLLKAKSHGYSRFEIDPEGNIVEFQTEGVEYEYMGRALKAFELRYDPRFTGCRRHRWGGVCRPEV